MTNSEAKRLIAQGGLRLNGVKETDPNRLLTLADFPNGEALLQLGKKHHIRLVLEDENVETL